MDDEPRDKEHAGMSRKSSKDQLLNRADCLWRPEGESAMRKHQTHPLWGPPRHWSLQSKWCCLHFVPESNSHYSLGVLWQARFKLSWFECLSPWSLKLLYFLGPWRTRWKAEFYSLFYYCGQQKNPWSLPISSGPGQAVEKGRRGVGLPLLSGSSLTFLPC